MKNSFGIIVLCISLFSLHARAEDGDEEGSSDSAPQAVVQPHTQGPQDGADVPPPPPPPPGHRGPPPREAVDACGSKAMDASCSFSGKGGESVSGECWQPDSSKPLACRPKDHP